LAVIIVTMDLNTLKDTPPWDWPEGTAKILLGILRDEKAAEADRVLAAEMAGDSTIVNDELVDALLSVLRSGKGSERLRGRAAISLGPALEAAHTEGFENSSEPPISESTFQRVQRSLRELYLAAETSQKVRRQILEASVRAPQDWLPDAIRAAYSSSEEKWKLTAVFCMRFVRGFDEQIREALESQNPDIHYQALVAAGNWGIEAAWPQIAALITSRGTPKDLLLAAIEAVPSICPQHAGEVLDGLIDSDDEDIAEAVEEALAMAEGSSDDDDDDEDDEDELFLR
jgi:hypothetical protein